MRDLLTEIVAFARLCNKALSPDTRPASTHSRKRNCVTPKFENITTRVKIKFSLQYNINYTLILKATDTGDQNYRTSYFNEMWKWNKPLYNKILSSALKFITSLKHYVNFIFLRNKTDEYKVRAVRRVLLLTRCVKYNLYVMCCYWRAV